MSEVGRGMVGKVMTVWHGLPGRDEDYGRVGLLDAGAAYLRGFRSRALTVGRRNWQETNLTVFHTMAWPR